MMNGRDIQIFVSNGSDAKRLTARSEKKGVLRRIWMILLDNRLEGRPELENALRPHPEEHQSLKSVLNILFVSVGVALFISVIVVIIYTVVDEYTTSTNRTH